ncbi:MAG: alpha-galactosidase [Lentisphaeria bacterium]|nr:alpha-galactosidase [Lentisphaeria bacterium]
MSKKSLNLAYAEKLFKEKLIDAENLPMSFVYDGKAYKGLGRLTKLDEKLADTPNGVAATLRYNLDDMVVVSLELAFNAEFGEMEYTVWFENTGKAPSKVLRDVYVIDAEVTGDNPVLRGCLGDHANFYAAYEHDLSKGTQYFRSDGGRATHVVFPYFDFVHGDGGTMFALGWAGTWNAMFSPQDGFVTLKAQTCNDFNAVLMPGEKVRTGLVVLLPYKGRNADDATNLWREWWMACNMPRANAQGDPIQPFSTNCWASDTGLPNSDGSISERNFTWKPTLDKILKENVKPTFRWFDAGWYFDPEGNTVESNWWGTIGSWELDRVKWPGNSFRESNDACHAVGMKVLVWFEPERVTNVPALVKNYGYKAEWAIDNGRGVITNNLGNEECLQWTMGRIIKMMDENGVDLFREDNNSDPGSSWPALDNAESRKYGVPRQGVNENKSIQGHYKLWDGIIDYCGKHGKCTFVDSCASGGGRNDIESMRRGIPFMRSDYDRTTTSMRLSMTASFCKWIPFHGASTKETQGQLESAKGRGSDEYVNRVSLLPVYNISGYDFTHNPEIDFNLLRRNFDEWKRYNYLLTRDLYVLTPWHHNLDRLGWTAFAYDAPERGESILLVFRMESCRTDTFTAKLPFAENGKRYELKNMDTVETVTTAGEKLRQEGVVVTLNHPRASALFEVKKL